MIKIFRNKICRSSSLYFSNKRWYATIFATEKKNNEVDYDSPLRNSEQIAQLSNANIH